MWTKSGGPDAPLITFELFLSAAYPEVFLGQRVEVGGKLKEEV